MRFVSGRCKPVANHNLLKAKALTKAGLPDFPALADIPGRTIVECTKCIRELKEKLIEGSY
jgi:hypothetical protein